MADKSDEDNSDTWDMPVHFKVRQHVSGGYWILIEQLDSPTLPIFDDFGGFLGIDLDGHTTDEEAMALAKQLDKHVIHLTYTGDKRPQWADNPGRGARAK